MQCQHKQGNARSARIAVWRRRLSPLLTETQQAASNALVRSCLLAAKHGLHIGIGRVDGTANCLAGTIDEHNGILPHNAVLLP